MQEKLQIHISRQTALRELYLYGDVLDRANPSDTPVNLVTPFDKLEAYLL